MTLKEARHLLSKRQFDELTEKALETGPFVVESVVRGAGSLEVGVRFPQMGNKRKTIEVKY